MRYTWGGPVVRRGEVLRGAVIGTAWVMVGLAVPWTLPGFARAIDDGYGRGHGNRALMLWVAAIVFFFFCGRPGIAWHTGHHSAPHDDVRTGGCERARSAGRLLGPLSLIGAVLSRKLGPEVDTVGGRNPGRVEMLGRWEPGRAWAPSSRTAVVAVVLCRFSRSSALLVLLGVRRFAVVIGRCCTAWNRARTVIPAQQASSPRPGPVTSSAGLRVLAGGRPGGAVCSPRGYADRSKDTAAEGYPGRCGQTSWIEPR